MKVFLTGMAGFIGFHTALALAEAGHEVFGVDNINAYYDPRLKHARLAQLPDRVGFAQLDIADAESFAQALHAAAPDVVVHLAAQPGVQYSIENALAYARSNLLGHLSVLEACRHASGLSHLIYASSSSVYGDTTPVPLRETARVDEPVSLYAATKRADELMSSTYAHLYGLKQVGLRFFTVYGRWGRPDMAYWIFADKILKGEPISIYNNGQMRRDMTHIRDVVSGILAAVETPPRFADEARPHAIYNVGNSTPEELLTIIDTLETALGEKAERVMLPMRPGDVTETYADISAFSRDYGYRPTTPISEGIPDFVDWFRSYRAGL
ncbi:MAG: NAD-dependent epimerase/dehydratase family protein [Hyphomonadaceae bacterium]|nr:NAD-dependent epimerase/dehydratase family protein [Hyphomonadaceae bacterium]